MKITITDSDQIATPQSRLYAYLLDGLIFTCSFGVGWLIWFIVLSAKSTTPGHHLMGHVIIDLSTGEPLGKGKLIIREILLKGLLQAILGGLLFMVNYIIDAAFIFTGNRRTLHDLVIGSQVIQK